MTLPSLTALRRAVADRPNAEQATFGIALREHLSGASEPATRWYQRTLAANAGSATAAANLAGLLAASGRPAAAIRRLRQAIAADPTLLEAYANLAVALAASTGGQNDILLWYRAAAQLPDVPLAHFHIGSWLLAQGRSPQAVRRFSRAIALAPDFAEALHNLGAIAGERRDDARAAILYRRVVATGVPIQASWANLGAVLHRQGLYGQAVGAWTTAVAIEPGDTATRWNLASTRLLLGGIERDLDDFEARHWAPGLPPPPDLPPEKTWRGEAMPQGRLYVYAEQGYGDTIQFARYLPRLQGLVGTVTLACPKPLHRLLSSLPSSIALTDREPDRASYDRHAPLLSLPSLLRLRPPTAGIAVPYLSADPALAAHWHRRLDRSASKPSVGIVWRGNPGHVLDRDRSLPLSALAPLLSLDTVRFVSLQKDASDERRALGSGVVDLGPELADFAETAAAIATLDLVIAPDTAVAHLAGALGKPTWIMLPFVPDWRWQLGRDDSPWYPSVRLFRQDRPGDWKTLVERIVAELATLPPRQAA